MFRMVSILGLGMVLLILAATAVLFSFRIVSDEDGSLATLLIVVSVCLAGAAGSMVYVARQRERENYEMARTSADLEQLHLAPNPSIRRETDSGCE